jgi:hypothetical protein
MAAVVAAIKVSLVVNVQSGIRCGAFGGDAVLKFLIQWMAAAEAGTSQTLHRKTSNINHKPCTIKHGSINNKPPSLKFLIQWMAAAEAGTSQNPETLNRKL